MTRSFEVDAILFDSDGVLVDSHNQVHVAWSALAREFELDFDVLATELAGVPARDTLGRHVAPADLDCAVARLEDLEVASAASTTSMAGACELTAQLPPWAWAVVTSASRRLGEARWRSAGVVVPAHVVTADDGIRGKPDPQPYLAAAALLGVEPARCIVFEDSPAGGAAAVAAGAITIAVGHQPWTAAPAARVTDLASVTVASAERDGGRPTLVVSVVDVSATAR